MADSKLDRAIKELDDQFGPNTVSRLGADARLDIAAIPTGALTLDIALGIGGVPRGRIVEVFSPEGVGKTTLCYHLIANCQAAGGTAAFIDAEHSMDPKYAARIGVDTDSLLVSQPDYGEAALETVDVLAKSGEVALICVDSVAALTPRAELEGQMGEVQVGLLARMMGQAMRKLPGSLRKTDTCLVFTNQIRMNVNTHGYGSPETQPGGRALRFHASQRIDMRRIEAVKSGDEITGHIVKAKAVKNKCASPYREALFTITYGEGINHEAALLDMGLDKGVVKKSGAHYTFNDTKKHGRRAMIEWLKDNPDQAGELEAAINGGAA